MTNVRPRGSSHRAASRPACCLPWLGLWVAPPRTQPPARTSTTTMSADRLPVCLAQRPGPTRTHADDSNNLLRRKDRTNERPRAESCQVQSKHTGGPSFFSRSSPASCAGPLASWVGARAVMLLLLLVRRARAAAPAARLLSVFTAGQQADHSALNSRSQEKKSSSYSTATVLVWFLLCSRLAAGAGRVECGPVRRPWTFSPLVNSHHNFFFKKRLTPPLKGMKT